MNSQKLVKDYLFRAENRIYAVEVLLQRNSYADVIRESQEIVELTLKALLRHVNLTVPHLHDVGQLLKAEKERLPKKIQKQLEEIAEISHDLRRDRELSFYGSEDITPSEFYEKKHADLALAQAKKIYKLVSESLTS